MCQRGKEGAPKRGPVIDNRIDREGKDGRHFRWKELDERKGGDWHSQTTVNAKIRMQYIDWKENGAPSISEDKSMTQFHFDEKKTKQKHRSLPAFLSLSSLSVFFFLSLASACDCIGLNSDSIDPVSPLRTNVISALCLCVSDAGAGLAESQVGE